MFRCQTGIPATQGQAIALTNDRTSIDRYRDIQLFHHRPDHSDLLEILFPEISVIRLYDIEQLTYYLRYTVKMPGRLAPSITSDTVPKSNVRVSGSGYISSTEGANT